MQSDLAMNLEIDSMRDNLFASLEEAEYLADDDVARAREIVPNLVAIIRGLVAEHDHPDSLNCRTCHQLWPCPTLTTAARLIKDPENELTKILKSAYRAGTR
jgi:hypothetical protein